MQNARKHPIGNFASRFVLVARRSFVFLEHNSEFNIRHYRKVYRKPTVHVPTVYSNVGGVFRKGRSFRNGSVQAADRVCFIPASIYSSTVWSGRSGLLWPGLSSKSAWGMARGSPRSLLHGAACDVSLNAIDSYDDEGIQSIVLLF